MRHVVMFSGGVGSWAAAKRVAERHGTEALTLLFADTKVEGDDLYRFLREAAANVGGELVTVADGRTPFQVFHDTRFLGNNRLARCSEDLKIKPCRAWLEEHCDPASTTLYVGIDWSEAHRLPPIVEGWKPYRVQAPLTEPPYTDKAALLDWLKAEGVEPPAAYGDGFPHSNCMEQGCVRGGHGYWALLLRKRPEVYRATEQEEEALRRHLDKDVSILRDRSGGSSTTLTLREFRERIECGEQPDMFDIGACGCFAAGSGS